MPRLRYRGLGTHRQGSDREGHRRRTLARSRSRSRPRILRGGRARFDAAAARAIARPPQPASLPTPNACCGGPTTAPRRLRRSKRAACRSTWRSGTWCRRTSRRLSALCYGNSTPVMAPRTQSTHPRANGVMPGSNITSRALALLRGLGWTAASSILAAMPSALCTTCRGSRICTHSGIPSASSFGRSCRSGATAGTGRVYFHSAR